MKRCELCKRKARLQCEADQASLCWDCDSKVHAANFLVARHSRNLLCRVCGSRLPWSASGSRVLPIASSCEECAGGNRDGAEEDEEEPVVEENEVSLSSSPPAADSCSSSDRSVTDRRDPEVSVSRKRCRTQRARRSFKPFNLRRKSPYSAAGTGGGRDLICGGLT